MTTTLNTIDKVADFLPKVKHRKQRFYWDTCLALISSDVTGVEGLEGNWKDPDGFDYDSTAEFLAAEVDDWRDLGVEPGEDLYDAMEVLADDACAVAEALHAA